MILLRDFMTSSEEQIWCHQIKNTIEFDLISIDVLSFHNNNYVNKLLAETKFREFVFANTLLNNALIHLISFL